MNARVAAALLTIAALVAVGLVFTAPGGLRWQAHPGSACDNLVALQGSMDLTSLGDQAVIRARAVQLAASLRTTADAGAVQRHAFTRLQTVIADPAATSHDLVIALTPLARSCGVTLAR